MAQVMNQVCICGHASITHISGKHLCNARDIHESDYTCNCEWYEPETKTVNRDFCDGCMEAIEEESYGFGLDEDGMEEALVSLGGDIADHICDRVEEPSIKCICGCQFAIY